MLAEARAILRDKFLSADIGLTGANFLVAETGTSIIVTNEGNGDLTQILPKVHIVLASIEKMVPTLDDAAQILRVLARSATGQDMSVYTTLSTGPRRPGDPDGPEEYHVVLLDNGRSAMLGGEFEDMLRCIRCGACMNHCPVYHAVGGHAYGWVYPGPMGAVLTPSLIGVEEGGQLPNASTFCGRCEAVCPMRIPLPNMMRHWREREFERHLSPATVRYGLGFWAFFARRPALYRLATDLAMRALHLFGRSRGRFVSLPLAGGWTRYRDLPAPQGATFQARWRAKKRSGAMSARDDILAAVRASLHVSGEEAPRRAAVASRLAEAPVGVVPQRGQGAPAERLATFKAEAERVRASVAEVASAADVPGRDRALPARKQSARDVASRRRSALGGHALATTALGDFARRVGGRRCQRGQRRLRRRRRDRHAGVALGPRQSDDAELPAGKSFVVVFAAGRGRRHGERHRKAADRLRRRRHAAHRSISSPARRARPTSSRRCCLGRMGRGGCIS